MRPVVIVNLERLDSTSFAVALLYGEAGELLDAVILPAQSASEALSIVRHIAATYGIRTCEMWTSDREIYMQTLQSAGIAGVIKHPSDTEATRAAIEQNADILRELYEIQPLTPKPPLPKWRAVTAGLLKNILRKLEGDDIYAI
ncbi:hypothetical protein [Paenibacillus hamazuiensis]|uniref:hypothetical protein n=1 Tax=Paenibacillus hamazuiensis TaxID=2936508 RepID=UPI00200D796B|nr:hypothetical protein [Paenibacillus hamazuiensis]